VFRFVATPYLSHKTNGTCFRKKGRQHALARRAPKYESIQEFQDNENVNPVKFERHHMIFDILKQPSLEHLFIDVFHLAICGIDAKLMTALLQI
jgi:hypothetical protein